MFYVILRILRKMSGANAPFVHTFLVLFQSSVIFQMNRIIDI